MICNKYIIYNIMYDIYNIFVISFNQKQGVLLNVACTFKLRPVSRGCNYFEQSQK